MPPLPFYFFSPFPLFFPIRAIEREGLDWTIGGKKGEAERKEFGFWIAVGEGRGVKEGGHRTQRRALLSHQG